MDRFFSAFLGSGTALMAKDVKKPSRTEGRPSEGDRARLARQKKLGEQLKKLYDDVANEPIPDEFLNILRDADKQTKSHKKG